jgi:hypothetical protein
VQPVFPGKDNKIFIKHCIEKLTGYSTMVHHFPTLMHIEPHVGPAFAGYPAGRFGYKVSI